MADTKLSALTELAATPASDDEVYIRDVSEAAATESKRITIANIVAAAVAAAEAAGLALASGKNIKVISALTSDDTQSGLTALMTAEIAIYRRQLVYVGADGKMERAARDSAATIPVIAITTETIAEDAVGEFLLQGYFRYDTWDGFTPGAILYCGLAGNVSETRPSASGDQVQVIGVAITSKIIYFNPSLVLEEIP